MRYITLSLFALLLAAAVCAQPSHLDRVYRQYSNENGQIAIDPGLLLNVSFSSKKISTLHCLIIKGHGLTLPEATAGAEFRDLEHAVHADHFEEWFSIRKGKGRVAAYTLEGPGDLEDLVCLLVGDDDGGLFFHLRGHFTAEDKARLEAALQDKECR
jgi:hypothetical protein